MSAAAQLLEDEIAASVIIPHFAAVRDVFSSYEPERGVRLTDLRDVVLEVTGSVRDSARHFAACRDDGKLILVAPELAQLPVPNLVAILAHEFGHAADFSYPRHWRFIARSQPARWKVPGPKIRKRVAWEQRSDDEVEWTADAIAQTVTGLKIGYCGPCKLQCFGGPMRPKGLR